MAKFELQEVLENKVLKLDNFDEIKEICKESVKKYSTLIVTEDAIGLAKKDRANLNARIKSISELRSKAKKEVVGKFDAQCKELIDILLVGVENIDKQVKDFEEKEKEAKKESIIHLFSELELNDAIVLGNVWNERWLNKTYPLEEIKNELVGINNKLNDDLEVIESLCVNDVELEIGKNELLKNLDLKKAIDKIKECREIEKIKKDKIKTTHYDEKIFELGFIVQVSYNQATALNDFLATNGIKFVQLTKEQIKKIKGE